jgi:hypothetical protein
VKNGIEISELTHASAPRTAPPPRRHRIPSARNMSSTIGIAGTLLLHTIALPSLILGVGSHKPHPIAPDGIGAQRAASPVPPAESLVLITLSNNAKPDADPLGGAAALQIQFEKVRVSVPTPPPPSLSFEIADDLPADAPAATVDAGDSAERALMFGRYTGQISARIERAWMRPRSPVSGSAPNGSSVAAAESKSAANDEQTFRCTVQIRQDAHGNVQEVLLLTCNGTEEWRHSLVVAINQASPLPAPPTPKVFTRALMMRFEGHAYGVGDGSDGYDLRTR